MALIDDGIIIFIKKCSEKIKLFLLKYYHFEVDSANDENLDQAVHVILQLQTKSLYTAYIHH